MQQRTVLKYKKEAAAMGKSSFYLAWLTDEGFDERSRGVTIGVASKHFKTTTKAVTILDAPGHADFVPAMISGATAADVALLVVAATPGEFEAGFYNGGQTREHALLLKSLGVNQVLVVVNKLDATMPSAFCRDRYDAIVLAVGSFLVRDCAFKPHLVRFVPVSAFQGHNVAAEGTSLSKPSRTAVGAENIDEGHSLLGSWGITCFADVVEETRGEREYGLSHGAQGIGRGLVDAIDSFRPPPRLMAERPLRIIVSDVQQSSKVVVVSGHLCQGTVTVGQPLLLLPWGDRAVASKIRDASSGKPLRSASFGMVSSLLLSLGVGDEIDGARVGVGDVLCCHPSRAACAGVIEIPVATAQKFEARVTTFEGLQIPFIRGSPVQLHIGHVEVAAHLSRLVSLLDRTGGVKKIKPRAVAAQCMAVVQIKCSRVICVEESVGGGVLGRFVLRMGGVTVAAGLVVRVF
jgi:elongation factor 1 alpha-like protein